MPETETTENAIVILKQILSYMYVAADVEAIDGGEEGGLKLKIASDEAGRLIGRSGQTLESLELVLNRMARRREEAAHHSPWISLEIDGYHVNPPRSEGGGRERRGKLPADEVERLQAMAADIAREVKKLGKPRVIGPFTPSERRVIHLALEGDTEVETVSDQVADENRGKKITVQLR